MRKLLFSGLFFLFNLVYIQAQEIKNFKSFWDKGYNLQSEDGNFKMKFGGRIQHQWSFFSQDTDIENNFGKANNGSEFRRIRFYNSGTIYKYINYKL